MGAEAREEGMFTGRKARRSGINIWMCLGNTESHPTTQTLLFQVRPGPSCASSCLKLQVQLFWGEPQKAPLSGYLAGFRVRTRTFIYLHDIWKRLWVIRDTILFQEFFFSFSYIRKENQVNLLKIDFQKSGKRTHFSSVQSAWHSAVLL
jgi:hypothetical protein